MDNAFALTRDELAAQRADMHAWTNLELAQRWAEAAWSAGNLYDWAKYKLEDRDEYVMHMAFAEDCLEEMETRAGDAGE